MVDAGPALDRAIAERVFGWTGCAPHAGRMYGMRPFPTPATPVWGQVPQYSTDIAAAWQVVEWLQTEGWVVVVTMDNGTGRYCKVWHLGVAGGPLEYEVLDALTVPDAICRGALAAVNSQPVPA